MKILHSRLGIAPCLGPQRCCQSVVLRKASQINSATVERVEETKARLVSSNFNITVAYRTGWIEGKLHGSLRGGEWKDYTLQAVHPVRRRWLFATVPAGEAGKDEVLFEFVVTNGKGDWDKPAAGGNYTVTSPGRYVLRKGSLREASAPPVMVVSDLDGTMVGDDAATGAFKGFWEEEGCPNGGVLVYNTGRALHSFVKLQEEKGHCLAPPDVLVSAVGTKIYNFTEKKKWEEDEGWKELLDQDWNVHEVVAAASHILTVVGSEKMHFRPKDEQNEHKVTCGVSTAVLGEVLAGLQDALDKAGVKANLITSGTKDWRFLDIVSLRAGKLEALEYVRKQHRFPLEQTVACGDSGNDILMLSGPNLALVVGNAQDDLKAWVEQHKHTNGATMTTKSAEVNGRVRLWVSSKHEAYGILQGLEYWGLKGKS